MTTQKLGASNAPKLHELADFEQPLQLTKPHLSIIIPVYNGANKIEYTVQAVLAKIEALESLVFDLETRLLNQSDDGYLPTTVSETGKQLDSGVLKTRSLSHENWFELILVNDGSKDNTAEIINEISKKDKRISTISYSVNMGKGYAIKQGVLHSQGRYIIFMDGDGDISADVLGTYLINLKFADLVIGSKYHPSSEVRVPLSRMVLSKLFQKLVRAVLGLKVSDTQVGLKAGRGDAFRKIFETVIVKRYAFDAEMLVVAKLFRMKVDEMPVKMEIEASFRRKEILRMALDVLAISYRLRVMKWYQKNAEKKRPHYRFLSL